jgi:hypothetical protein
MYEGNIILWVVYTDGEERWVVRIVFGVHITMILMVMGQFEWTITIHKIHFLLVES